ncbi:MAG: methylenetetrahydrofolate reductase [Porticoccaceae bacterium]|nr:methylenetetrahydrofolate reductase [Porticoccaceae bacterium]
MSDGAHLSFEFFSVKSDLGRQNVAAMCRQLDRYKPAFYSVTYGAGGSTRTSTQKLVMAIQNEGYTAAPHLSFGGDSADALVDLLDLYRSAGVYNVVALRGDLPSGVAGIGKLTHANELVSLIRDSFGDHFDISVAAYPEIHPEAESYDKDVYWLGEKFRAGANRAITQYFYNADGYFRFLDEAAKQGIEAPIVPGIMPLTNYQNLLRFSENCGAEIPRWLRWQLKQRSKDRADLVKFGIDVVTELCNKLLTGGAPGLHFYSMNNITVVDALCKNIDLAPRPE